MRHKSKPKVGDVGWKRGKRGREEDVLNNF